MFQIKFFLGVHFLICTRGVKLLFNVVLFFSKSVKLLAEGGNLIILIKRKFPNILVNIKKNCKWRQVFLKNNPVQTLKKIHANFP